MEATNPVCVLVIEDDPDARANLRDILELDDYLVETAGSAAEAFDRTDWTRFSAIILDRRLPDATAVDMLPRLRRVAPASPVIIVTGYADLEGAVAALRHGAADYILKPLNPEALRASLERITERQRLAQAKERSESAFRNLVEAAGCLIIILRPDHSILYFSPFAERLTDYPAAEAIERGFLALFPAEPYRRAVADEVARVLSGQPTQGYECPVVCRDGSRRWVVWNARGLPDYEGGPAILAVGQDITVLKQAQERALQSERLAAIGQMVAGLAHESRNALQRSQACLEMLQLQVTDRPSALDLINRIQKAQDHLHHLYEDVQGYAAPIRLKRRRCSMLDIWREAWSHLEHQRAQMGALLKEEPANHNLCCTVDPFRLEQVFRNIFDNALAAGSRPVELVIRTSESHQDSVPSLRISVQDNGPGLDAEQRAKIFDPFYTTKTKGTGLGMAISKRVIEAHGGRIWVGDGSGRGAEIILSLPRDCS